MEPYGKLDKIFHIQKPIIMSGNTMTRVDHVAEDGSVFRGVRDEKGTLLPGMDGILDRVKRIKDLCLREDDIFVCAYPKSGTHWVANIVELLLHNQKSRDEEWLPGDQLLLDMFGIEPCDTADSPRVMVTHLTPDYLPPDLATSTSKFIYVTREPKDLIVSMYYFCRGLGDFEGTLRGLAELFLQGKLVYGDWYDHMEAYKNFVPSHFKDTFLSLSYESLKKVAFLDQFYILPTPPFWVT